MKATLIGSVVLTLLAGMAAAGMMMSAPTRAIGSFVERTALPAHPLQGSPTSPASTKPPPAVTPILTVPAAPLPRPESASVEAARPPVPLRVNRKPPLPDKPAASNGKASADMPEAVEASADQRSQQAAKAAIEADGYKSVQILSQGSNGVWKASALRGKTRVVVKVDQAGNVFTE